MLNPKDKMELMQNLWNTEDNILLERLNKDILSVPTLAIPDPSRRFYIKIDCSKDGMEQCSCKQMSQRKQENQRHKKRPAESANLTSP